MAHAIIAGNAETRLCFAVAVPTVKRLSTSWSVDALHPPRFIFYDPFRTKTNPGPCQVR